MKDILPALVIAAMFFFIGWVLGADHVLFECRVAGATQFLGKSFVCYEAKP